MIIYQKVYWHYLRSRNLLICKTASRLSMRLHLQSKFVKRRPHFYSGRNQHRLEVKRKVPENVFNRKIRKTSPIVWALNTNQIDILKIMAYPVILKIGRRDGRIRLGFFSESDLVIFMMTYPMF